MRYILIIAVLFTSCHYHKDGKLVKDQDGNVYKLKKAVANESYFLEEIDTLEYKRLSK